MDPSDHATAFLLQTALQTEGLYEGALDGVWGPKSVAAFQTYRNYQRYADVAQITERLTPDQHVDLARFTAAYKQNEGIYLAVGGAARVPQALVAALHWRESGGNFTTYLHNGDPLGRPTVHEPKGILFSDWKLAAIDAITREKLAYDLSGIEEWTNSLPCLCVFAEAFNGEGYAHMSPPRPDPYVLAGTSGYDCGKFTADEVYDPAAVDGQLGVLVLLRAILT